MAADLEERGRALENDYFRRKEQELIEKMKSRLGAQTAGARNCPKCDGKLVETDFENIKVDVCDKCTGVWLDAGELAQILHQDSEDKGWFSRVFG